MEKGKLDQLNSLFNLARHHRSQGREERFAAYAGECATLALDALRDGAAPARSIYGKLYQLGRHDLLFELAEAGDSGRTGDFLPCLAVASAFALKDPHRAADLARRIGDAEQRLLRLKTAALWADLHAPLVEEPRVHLIVLTHNRAAYVEQALRQLGETAYRNYAVYIADNGSSDGTREISLRAREFFPPHVQVETQAFPVNIGRPAGHNWLLAGYDHDAAEFIAIGDDDLTRVPPDWLTRMVRTAQVFSGCACVGGKALNPGWPARVHCGARNVTVFGRHLGLEMTNDGEQEDLGQFDYVDLVDHVIGCLHIFDRRALEESGFFDIRFSPSQCVDVEHHLRLRLAGKNIVFNGLIAFEHQRVTGNAAAGDEALMGNSMGNVVKLLYKYNEKEVRCALEERRRERAAWLEKA